MSIKSDIANKVMNVRLVKSLMMQWWYDEGKEQEIIMSPLYYEKLHELLRIYKVDGLPLVRIGCTKDGKTVEGDGAYIMVDDFSDKGIAYSFGISDDVAWDTHMMRKGYDIYMYDPTIEGLPYDNQAFHFFKQGISDGVTQDSRMKPLEYFVDFNGHSNCDDMILKMDVEGAEWGFLFATPDSILEKFSQISFEMHGLVTGGHTDEKLKALEKLNKTHRCIHIHPNNFSKAITVNGKLFANDIEVTYVSRRKYDNSILDYYDVKLPIDIDRPNRKRTPEMCLDYWNHPIENLDNPVLGELYLKR